MLPAEVAFPDSDDQVQHGAAICFAVQQVDQMGISISLQKAQAKQVVYTLSQSASKQPLETN
jgi:hypothetical protein